MPQQLPESVETKRARLIVERLMKRLITHADKLLAIYPECRLTPKRAAEAGVDAAVQALFDLDPAVVAIVSFRVLQTMAFMVAVTAINEAVDADLRDRPPRTPHDTLSVMRANAVLKVVLPRLVIGANELLGHYTGCKLRVGQVYPIGEAAVLDTLLNLPPAIINVASERALGVISYYAGWTAIFDAIDADLRLKFPPGRFG